MRDDPEFAAKAAEVVGLHMVPPKNAIVLCVDEKPSIQSGGTATITGDMTHRPSAFEVATDKLKATHKKLRRRKESFYFMVEVVSAYPKRRLEVILDNLNTHKE